MKHRLIIFLLILFGISVHGQPIFNIPENKTVTVGWHYEHPSFDFISEEYNIRFIDGFHDLEIGFFASKKLFLNVQFPVALTKLTIHNSGFEDMKRYESTIGNPSLAFYLPMQNNSYLFTQLTVPIVSKTRFQSFLFRYSSDIDKLEAYYPKMWAWRLGFKKNIPVNQRFFIRNLAAIKFLYLSDKDYYYFSDDDLEAWLQLQSQFTFYPFENKTAFHMGISGIFWISQNKLNISELSNFYFSSSVSFKLKDLQPGVFLRLPLDDPNSDFLKFVFGIQINKSF